MKIEYNTNTNLVFLEQIEEGEGFTYEGTYFVRMNQDRYYSIDKNIVPNDILAFNLNLNLVARFSMNPKVVRKKLKVVVEE